MDSSQRSTNEFLNKNIVVTGASSGIGLSIATYFLNCGAIVVLCGRDVDGLIKIGSQFPNHASIISCDLSQDMELYDLKSSIIEKLGTIDILVNCAGIKFDGDVTTTFPQDFDYTIDVNLRSVFILIQCFEKFYSTNASIVNVSCLYGSKPMSGFTSYCMSKAGLETLTKYAAAEYANSSIRINAVTACPVISNSLRYVKADEKENELMEEKMKKNVPLGRIALPDDIAKAIVFLCSKRSSSITGQIIKVDGGRSLTSSGYVHFLGLRNMNSRFEPDDVQLIKKVSSIPYINNITNMFKKEDTIPKTKEALEKYIDDKIEESHFSTRLTDAHAIVSNTYKGILNNNDILYEKYSKPNS